MRSTRKPSYYRNQPASRSDITTCEFSDDTRVRYFISVLASKKRDVLDRVVTMIECLGYEIESIAQISQLDDAGMPNKKINIVVLDRQCRIDRHLEILLQGLPAVREVRFHYNEEKILFRELALIRVLCGAKERGEVLRLGMLFNAPVVSSGSRDAVLQVSGSREKIDALVSLLEPLGVSEIARTGIAILHQEGAPLPFIG